MFDMHYDLLTLIYMADRMGVNVDDLLLPLNSKNVKGVC